MTRSRQRVLVLVLALAAFLVPAATAYAVWSATATVAVTANTISVVPPTNVACSGSNNAITLSWTAVSGATGYTVYRKPNATTFVEAGTTTGTSLLLNEAMMGTPTESNGKYDVVVRASNGGGSADSAIFKIQFKPSCAQ